MLCVIRLARVESVGPQLQKTERIYACDAYILACAQKYRTPLLTLDNQLQRVALKQGVEILEV